MGLSLNWSNEQDAHAIDEPLIEKLEMLLRLAGESEQVETGDVALTFVDDEEIHRLNREYRGIDQPTDVLSFALTETGDGEPDINYDDLEVVSGDGDGTGGDEQVEDEVMLGDIVISVPRAIAQAQEYGHSFERELGFLFVHGFLHLLGYDHDDEQQEKEMFGKQETILQKAGLTR